MFCSVVYLVDFLINVNTLKRLKIPFIDDIECLILMQKYCIRVVHLE